MLKRIIAAVLWLPLAALAQSYPSPTFNNLTVLGNASISGALTVTGGNSIGLGALAQQAANTVLANATGSTANVTAFSMPSCSTSASALNWTSGSGFTCGTVATSGANSNITSLSGLSTPLSVAQGGTGRATLTSHGVLVGESTSAINQTSPGTTGQVLVGSTSADPAFGTTVAGLTFTSAITPQSTGGIVGTTTNDNANAGSVGEFLTNTTIGISLTTGTVANATSLTLTAGDWDVSGTVIFNPGASTTISSIIVGISPTSVSFGSFGTASQLQLSFQTGTSQISMTPLVRISISTNTTIYLVCESVFGVSTMTANGLIRARRVR